MSIEQRIAKIRGHADSLLDAYIGLRLNYALLKPLLGDLDRPIPHVQSDGLRSGLPALRATLFTVCVLDAVKLTWDRATRTPSIYNIVATLDDEAVRDVLRRGVGRVDVIRGDSDAEEYAAVVQLITESERERRSANVHEGYARLKQKWSRLDSLACKPGLLALRDRSIAHLELRHVGKSYEPIDVDGLGVRRRDLSTVIDLMADIVFDITSVVRDSHFAMDRTTEMFDSHGQSFWRRLGLGAAE